MKLEKILEERRSPWHIALIGTSKKSFLQSLNFCHISRSRGIMTSDTKLDEKLEGAGNFRAWKYRVMLILEENDLEGFIKE